MKKELEEAMKRINQGLEAIAEEIPVPTKFHVAAQGESSLANLFYSFDPTSVAYVGQLHKWDLDDLAKFIEEVKEIADPAIVDDGGESGYYLVVSESAAMKIAALLSGWDPEPSQSHSTPHADESGPSRPVVIASAMDDCGTNGQLVHHMTPAEEAEYNEGMARLAEWGRPVAGQPKTNPEKAAQKAAFFHALHKAKNPNSSRGETSSSRLSFAAYAGQHSRQP